MTPYERARAVYDAEPCARSFLEDLHLHFLHGYVFSTPDYFIMGRAVVSTAPHSEIIDPAHVFSQSLADCWHVYLFAGNIAPAFALMPRPLPLVSFERRNELRFYDLARLRAVSMPHH